MRELKLLLYYHSHEDVKKFVEIYALPIYLNLNPDYIWQPTVLRFSGRQAKEIAMLMLIHGHSTCWIQGSPNYHWIAFYSSSERFFKAYRPAKNYPYTLGNLNRDIPTAQGIWVRKSIDSISPHKGNSP